MAYNPPSLFCNYFVQGPVRCELHLKLGTSALYRAEVKCVYCQFSRHFEHVNVQVSIDPHLQADWYWKWRPDSTTVLLYSVASSVSSYNPSARTPRKTAWTVDKASLWPRCLATDVLLSHFGSRGNVFTESLPTNGYTSHNIMAENMNCLIQE
jgi:hypothetical protein